MRFADPTWLYALLAVPAWVAVAWLARRARLRALARFAGGGRAATALSGDVGPNRRVIKGLLLVLAFVSIVLALARPQWGEATETVERAGIDLVLVVDTSRSMAVEDVSPDRFRQARLSAAELVRRLRGDRIGLIAFAGKASLLCPLTVDHEAIGLFLDALDLDSAPIPGTALAEALLAAGRAFGPEVDLRDDDRARMVVVYSDGEDHEAGLDEAIEALNRAGIAVFTVGVGTVEGGPIPAAGQDGSGPSYVKDRDGRVVTSRLDEGVLERLALDTGGRYHRATAAGVEIDDVVNAVLGAETGEFGASVRIRYRERYAIGVWLALLALLAEAAIPDGRGRRVREDRS